MTESESDPIGTMVKRAAPPEDHLILVRAVGPIPTTKWFDEADLILEYTAEENKTYVHRDPDGTLGPRVMWGDG